MVGLRPCPTAASQFLHYEWPSDGMFNHFVGEVIQGLENQDFYDRKIR